jgi:hypothetical protein
MAAVALTGSAIAGWFVFSAKRGTEPILPEEYIDQIPEVG